MPAGSRLGDLYQALSNLCLALISRNKLEVQAAEGVSAEMYVLLLPSIPTDFFKKFTKKKRARSCRDCIKVTR